MVQSVASRSPILSIENALEDTFKVVQKFLDFELTQLSKADKRVKAVLEAEGDEPQSLFAERDRLRERKEAALKADAASDDDLTDTIEQLQQFDLGPADSENNARVARELAEREEQIPVLQNENDELEAELAQLQSVLRLSEQLLGMKVKTETKDEARKRQVIRFTFTKIVRLQPEREFILRLTLQEATLTGMDTSPELPQTPELQRCMDAVKADRHKLKALVKHVRGEFSRMYYSADCQPNRLVQAATLIT